MNIKIYIILLACFSCFGSVANEDTSNDLMKNINIIDNNNVEYIYDDSLINQISRDWIQYQRSLSKNVDKTCLVS
tara:strand:+ start:56 stop:280 length:225 start_codon:yes stop_codon:yes gene_type:complete